MRQVSPWRWWVRFARPTLPVAGGTVGIGIGIGVETGFDANSDTDTDLDPVRGGRGHGSALRTRDALAFPRSNARTLCKLAGSCAAAGEAPDPPMPRRSEAQPRQSRRILTRSRV